MRIARAIVGNIQQFRHWIEDFLIPKKVLIEGKEIDFIFIVKLREVNHFIRY